MERPRTWRLDSAKGGRQKPPGVDRDHLPTHKVVTLALMAFLVGGMLAWRQLGPARNRERRIDRERRQCGEGSAFGCFELGHSYAEGHEVPRDLDQAAALYQRACDGGEAGGCNSLGHLLSAKDAAGAEGLARDYPRAVVLFERACALRLDIGCRNLAVAHEDCKVMPRDLERAVDLYQKACALGDKQSCGTATATRGRPAPLEASVYRASCEQGQMARCADLGHLYQCGLGGLERDPEQATVFLQMACSGGDSVGCDLLERYAP